MAESDLPKLPDLSFDMAPSQDTAKTPVMPAAIRVGPVDYRVVEEQHLHGVDGNNTPVWMNGMVSDHECIIKIDAETSEQVRPSVLLHETIHALLNQAGIENHPEQVVMALGYGLVRVLRDNPNLVAYMLGEAAG